MRAVLIIFPSLIFPSVFYFHNTIHKKKIFLNQFNISDFAQIHHSGTNEALSVI